MFLVIGAVAGDRASIRRSERVISFGFDCEDDPERFDFNVEDVDETFLFGGAIIGVFHDLRWPPRKGR